MKYREFIESVKDVPISDRLQFGLAVTWLNPDRLPRKLMSLGGETMSVIKVPGAVLNINRDPIPVIAVHRSCFSGNQSLTDVILPSNIRELPAGAFAGCSSLRSVTIPRRVKLIERGTFAGCSNLEDIYYEGTLDEWRDVRIVNCRDEIEFGPPVQGSPVLPVRWQTLEHLPGNEPLFSADIHLRCGLGDPVWSPFKIRGGAADVSSLFKIQ